MFYVLSFLEIELDFPFREKNDILTKAEGQFMGFFMFLIKHKLFLLRNEEKKLRCISFSFPYYVENL